MEGADPDRLDSLRDRVAIGSAEYVRRLKEGLGTVSREADTKRVLRHRVGFADVVLALNSVCGVSWEDVLARHGDRRMWLVLRLARRYTGMTLKELGTVAGAKDYAAVGMGLRRLENKLNLSPGLQQLETNMEQLLYVET